MKRATVWLKVAGAAALLAGLGAVALVLTLKTYFPEPKLRAMTVDAARKQLGREVRLERIGVGLTGVWLSGLEVSEKPDFAAGTFLRVEDFRLRPSWRALLSRKLVVASVSADGLSVRVTKGADGRFNYESLMSAEASATPTPAAKPSEPAPELAVRRATVARGKLEYADKTDGSAWTVSDLEVDLRGFRLDAPFDLETSARVVGKAGARPVDAKLAFAGTVDLARGDRAAFKADVRKLVVEAEGARLKATGKAEGLESPKAAFEADLSLSGKDLLHASGTAALGSGGTMEADVKARTPGVDTRLLSKFVAGLPALDLPAADLKVAGRRAGDRVEVRSFSVSWKGGEAAGSGSVAGLGGPSPKAEGQAKFGLDVPEIKPGQYPFLKLPPKAFVPATRLDGEIALSGDELRVAFLKARFSGGTASVAGSVKRVSTAKPDPELSVVLALDVPSFKASDLPVSNPAIPASLVVPALRLDGGVKVSGDDARLDKLTVKGKAGRLTLDGTVAKALAGAPIPDVAVTADLDLPALTDKDLPFPGVPAGLQAPPSKWSVDASYSPRLLKLRSLRVVVGKNDLDASGTVTDPGGRNAFDLLLKCRSFALDELTKLTPQTREEKLSGTGFFALSVTGTKEKPLFAGKLLFKGIGATVAELPFADFTGTVSFDERRIDLPNLTGKVGDGTLKMDLTVKDYARAPEIQFDADLDRFDLGRWLQAKAKVQADHQASKAAAGGAKPDEKPTPIATRGHFNVGHLAHPNATVEDVKASWDLRGVTPDMKSLTGDARLHAGGGKFRNLQDLALQSKVMKVLSYPLRVIALGDLNLISLNQYSGDFGFKDGVMTLRQSEIDMDKGQVTTSGTIDLPRESLDLLVTSQLGRIAPVETSVTGTMSQPKTKTNVAKLLTTPLRQLLEAAQPKDQ